MMQGAPEEIAEDPVLSKYVADAKSDADTLGVLLHGSRASGRARTDSDYDLIRVVTQEAYDARGERGELHQRSSLDDGSIADVLYQTPSRIATYVTTPGWYTATYLGARVAFDRTGEIGAMLARMRAEADRIAHENTATAYDAYLNSFVRSMKSARRGDSLGQRLHAAESALALIRTLFGLESTWPPYHDDLDPELPRLEQAQGWPPGFLAAALSRLCGDADASFQQDLEGRVERLMTSRGVAHEWGDDLEPLKALRFDVEGSVDPASAAGVARSVAERFYRALEEDDVPSVLELCADDVTVQYPAEGALAYGGAWRGRDGLARFLDVHDESEDILAFDVERLIDDGDTVMALGVFRGRAKPEGREWTTSFVHRLTIVGGRLQRWEAYFDTAAALVAHRRPPRGGR